ncbi:hypothetical protein SDC9_185549 [bioreactor metagenome]|uniref:Uncharacterized protein n=1 Tax=bioreactor metagenome TaxID=1076179 RepID=A0A645HHG5_9ZZZZ
MHVDQLDVQVMQCLGLAGQFQELLPVCCSRSICRVVFKPALHAGFGAGLTGCADGRHALAFSAVHLGNQRTLFCRDRLQRVRVSLFQAVLLVIEQRDEPGNQFDFPSQDACNVGHQA